MKLSRKELTILWSLGWALLIIGAAFVFKDTQACEWVISGLTGLFAVFVILRTRRPASQR
ncbi:MAG: hypothetical protein WA823_00490 [Candidatus Acidiferrales bacterium]